MKPISTPEKNPQPLKSAKRLIKLLLRLQTTTFQMYYKNKAQFLKGFEGMMLSASIISA